MDSPHRRAGGVAVSRPGIRGPQAPLLHGDGHTSHTDGDTDVLHADGHASHTDATMLHADGRISMAQYAIDAMPSRDDVGGTLAAAAGVLDNIASLYTRVMGELAQIAERVEAVVGLKPLDTKPVESEPPA